MSAFKGTKLRIFLDIRNITIVFGCFYAVFIGACRSNLASCLRRIIVWLAAMCKTTPGSVAESGAVLEGYFKY